MTLNEYVDRWKHFREENKTMGIDDAMKLFTSWHVQNRIYQAHQDLRVILVEIARGLGRPV